MIDNGICIHESYSTAADKEAIVTVHTLERLPWLFIPPDFSSEEAGKSAHLPVFSWKGSDYIFFKLLHEGLASS